MNAIFKYLTLLFFIASATRSFAQNGFEFEDDAKRKVVIPFRLINNLIFIPVTINGVELNFLLDTGVEETVLFSLEDQSAVDFFNVKKIKMSGLGSSESIDGLKSSDNVIAIGGLVDQNHDVYIVLDQDFNFSSHVGIPVNGIIGYHFFKNHAVEINYQSKKINIYKDSMKLTRRIGRDFESLNMTIESNKPYTFAKISLDSILLPVKLLVDTGNSDAIWLFSKDQETLPVPNINFEDYLGRGFSGDIYGKRARIGAAVFGPYSFSSPLAAFPDSASVSKVTAVANRSGSVGGEILKRFTVIFDYKNNSFHLRKGKHYAAPFHYNMSGIDVQHNGMTWVQEKIALRTSENAGYQIAGAGPNSFSYKFVLKPAFVITNIRKDSPSDIAGLRKEDVLVSVNGRPAYKFSLEAIASVFMSEETKTVRLQIIRDGKFLDFHFKLKKML